MPIVIHNAIDVAPRGQYVFRSATVKVTVLPAVDTSDWQASSMNEHVDYVRDMFLEELDQMQFQISDQEREKSEARLKNLKRKEAAKKASKNKKSTKVSVKSASQSSTSDSKAKTTKKKTVKKKSATPKLNGDTKRKVKAVETKRKPRRRTRKLSAVKVSAKSINAADNESSAQ